MILKRLITLFILFGFISVAHAQKDGWLQPKSGYYLKLSEWWLVSDHHYDQEGTIQANFTEYGYYSTILHAEYGLNNRITSFLNFPFLNYTYSIVPSTLDRQSLWKTGDADIGLLYALTLERTIVSSVSLTFGLPLGYSEGIALQTGDGEFNQMIKMNAGHEFNLFNSNGWMTLYAGYNHRSHDSADELHYGFESGIQMAKNKVTLILKLNGIQALDAESSTSINPQSLFSNQRSYLSFSPEIIFDIHQVWGLTIGATTLLYGKNIFAGTSLDLGIIYKMIPPGSE